VRSAASSPDAVKAAAPDGHVDHGDADRSDGGRAAPSYKDITYDRSRISRRLRLGADVPVRVRGKSEKRRPRHGRSSLHGAKANPGKADYATPAPAACRTSSACCLGRGIGVEMVMCHTRASAAYMNDLIGGQSVRRGHAIADLTELHRAGQGQNSRSSGAKRSTALPDVPTFNELGVTGVEAMGWLASSRPRRPPRRSSTRSIRVNKALQCTPRRGEVTGLGMDPATGTPEQFAKIVADD